MGAATGSRAVALIFALTVNAGTVWAAPNQGADAADPAPPRAPAPAQSSSAAGAEQKPPLPEVSSGIGGAAPAPAPTASSSAAPYVPPPPPSPAKVDAANDAELVRALLAARPDLACDYHGYFAGPNQISIACGAVGLLIAERAVTGLRIVELRDVSGAAQGFFEADGKVWLRVVSERGVVLGSSAGGTVVNAEGKPPKSAPKQKSPPEKRVSAESESVEDGTADELDDPQSEELWPQGKVTAVDGLMVKIDLGTADAIEMRSKVAFFEASALGEGADEQGLGMPGVVGLVVEVAPGFSMVRVGMNERVRVGTPARRTRAPITASRVAPARASGVYELRGIVRPMLNLGTFGGGVLGDFSGAYRAEHFHFGVAAAPLGAATADGESAVTAAGYVFGAFDSRLFSAGLGVGAQQINDTDFNYDEGSGLTLVQLLRIGALDGLHLASRTKAVVFHSETQFSSLEIQGQISVSNDAWLILRGGGGVEGYGFGEIALRNLLRGSGGPGSFFLEIAVGGAGLYSRFCAEDVVVAVGDPLCSEVGIGGPLIGVGGEWRL